MKISLRVLLVVVLLSLAVVPVSASGEYVDAALAFVGRSPTYVSASCYVDPGTAGSYLQWSFQNVTTGQVYHNSTVSPLTGPGWYLSQSYQSSTSNQYRVDCYLMSSGGSLLVFDVDVQNGQ